MSSYLRSFVLLGLLASPVVAAPPPAFEGAEGFGAVTRGGVGVFTDEKQAITNAASEVRAQIAKQRLFAAPFPVAIEPAADAQRRVLPEAGCSRKGDAVDERILADVAAGAVWPDCQIAG